MIKSYRTDYPNQVHQLTISVSNHFYVTNSNILKYQHKKIEKTLKDINDSSKIHIVHYIIRDHTSGLFYAELSASKKLINPMHFLYRAWSKKEELNFYGMPENISIPKTIQSYFPSLSSAIHDAGINLVDVTSGFQGGIGDVKSLDEYLKFYAEQDVSEAYSTPIFVCQVNAKRKLRQTNYTKSECWERGIKNIQLPPDSWIDNA